ncbi:MAG TPA: FtsX-like permease family protein, partial [Steroidobacteraceae bacterium]|nr:FtsX-like permease family protein [Steroidobacteraceae bacterium]
RALGVTRGELQAALVAEGASLGALGSVLGVVAGAALAAFALRNYRGDLGDGHLRAVGVALLARPAVLAVFLAVGTLVATIGAWFAARSAARRPPAAALKGAGGDADPVTTVFRWRAGAALGALGAVLAWLPSIGGLALFGYASIAALLLGAVLLVPVATAALLRTVPAIGRPVIDTALAQLRDNVGPATLSLGSIVVSFGLMVAMMTMVHSFRLSFEAWLGQLLPADLEMRVPLGSNSAYWSAAEQNRIASIAGVARVEFRRTRRISLDPARPAVTLIARDIDTADARRVLPIVREAAPPLPAALPPAWISEGLQDLYGARVGAVLTLPLGGRAQRFAVAGVWRDYARSDGSVVVPRPAYEAATGDRTATQASLWLAPGATVASVEAAVRKLLAPADAVEIRTSTDIRARSLRIFDRAFAITYALEAVAVAIGLAGVAFAIGSTTLARRAEFGMLRHIGLRRRDVIALLATEGVALTALGVLYGLLLGLLLSLVLVYVVDRQSFHWSIDLAVPLRELLTLGAILVAAAASTALVAGRAAMSADAVRAIREDW